MELNRSGRRELAWHLRNERGWPLTRIGQRLGVSGQAVSRLLRRRSERCGAADALPHAPPRMRAIRPASLWQSCDS